MEAGAVGKAGFPCFYSYHDRFITNVTLLVLEVQASEGTAESVERLTMAAKVCS